MGGQQGAAVSWKILEIQTEKGGKLLD